MHIYINVILNKTVTKLFTILTKCFFQATLTEKIIVSAEKFMLPRKIFNMIVFCKAQHNA